MAPFYLVYVRFPRAETLASNDSRAVSPRTIVDVVIGLIIFFALLLSLCILAYRHPTLMSSLRTSPNYGPAAPITQTAVPVHSFAIPGRSFTRLTHLWGMSPVIYRRWVRISHNGISRNRSTVTEHNESSFVRASSIHAPPADGGTDISSRAPTPITIAFTPSGGSSTVGTFVDGARMEYYELGAIKGLSTSSLVGANDVGIVHVQPVVMTVPVIHIPEGPKACEPCFRADFPTEEVDITDVDKVAKGRQALQ